MALTNAEIETRLEEVLWDTTDTYWANARILSKMVAVLKQISQRVPFVTTERHPSDRAVPIRGEYTTDGDTRDIILTDWDFEDLVRISQEYGVEYVVDQSPKQFRNFKQHGKIVAIELDSIPDEDDDVYIYPCRQHILQADIGTTDTAAAVSTAGAIGDTSLIVKELGTLTINKYTKLTIAGDATEYMVMATATITGNVATVTLTPALVAVEAVDAVVTLALADSTLTPDLEEILIKWVSGELISDYAIKMLPLVPKGARHMDYTQKGELMIAQAKQELRNLETPDVFVRHSRS